jgi:DNA segregation ATPase FtsK/SpoIIIE-like protein
MIKGKSGYVAISNIRFLPTIDPLLADAKKIVLEMGEVRVGKIQQKMRIGYTRAARLIDLMCDDGFLVRNNEGRPILVTIIERQNTNSEEVHDASV